MQLFSHDLHHNYALFVSSNISDVQMELAGTVEFFLLSSTLLDKMDTDSRVDEVDERTCEIDGELNKDQPSSTSLKEVM
jgi:hypothetical protein